MLGASQSAGRPPCWCCSRVEALGAVTSAIPQQRIRSNYQKCRLPGAIAVLCRPTGLLGERWETGREAPEPALIWVGRQWSRCALRAVCARRQARRGELINFAF